MGLKLALILSFGAAFRVMKDDVAKEIHQNRHGAPAPTLTVGGFVAWRNCFKPDKDTAAGTEGSKRVSGTRMAAA